MMDNNSWMYFSICQIHNLKAPCHQPTTSSNKCNQIFDFKVNFDIVSYIYMLLVLDALCVMYWCQCCALFYLPLIRHILCNSCMGKMLRFLYNMYAVRWCQHFCLKMNYSSLEIDSVWYRIRWRSLLLWPIYVLFSIHQVCQFLLFIKVYSCVYIIWKYYPYICNHRDLIIQIE